jgi:hypothetical protein
LVRTSRLAARWLRVVALLLGLSLTTGCTGSRPPYDSNRTDDFVSVDTTEIVGVPLTDVYSRVQLRPDWPQQALPLEAPGPEKVGQVRTVVRFRLRWPIRQRIGLPADLYAFTVCEITDGTPCDPARFTLFFSVETPTGAYDTRRFSMRPARRLTLMLDGETTLDGSMPAYESHRSRETILEELWLAVSASTFRQIIQAERIHFRFGRDNLRLGGREIKPLRALWAATRGEANLRVE